MAKNGRARLSACSAQTAESRDCGDGGTAFATIAITKSGTLPSPVTVKAWGGARNRADRVSQHLTKRQCADLMAAAAFAEHSGLPFNRHWTIHYERAGIADRDACRFIGHVLKLTAAQARRAGGTLAAVWVRENGKHKGGHVHILMHFPAGARLRGRTARWIKVAGGQCRDGVSVMRSIGGRLSSADSGSAHYRQNVCVVRDYLLKATLEADGIAFGLPRYGESGAIIGKRAGWTQNIGRKRQAASKI